MTCPVAGCPGVRDGRPWDPQQCQHYYTAPEAFRQFLQQVWRDVPRDPRPVATAAKVYAVYSHRAGESDGDDFPLHEDFRWESFLNRNRDYREVNRSIVERIYLSARSAHIGDLFNLLRTLASLRLPDAVVRMKRATADAAGKRLDNIVVYTTGSAATYRVLGELHQLMQQRDRQGIPMLPAAWLRGAIPPGTRATGMPGIGVAEEPIGGDSFGGFYSRIIARAYDQMRDVSGMDPYRFACVALAHMRDQHLDPHQPWLVRPR